MNRYLIFFIFFLLSLFRTGEAQPSGSIPNDIIKSIRAGNAARLSSYFNSSVQLVILEKGNVYSRSQAAMIMKDFFKKNPPKGFTIIHQGGKANAHYGIGLLKTDKQTFRIYLLIKPDGNKSFIHQLRIEKENG